MGELGIVLPVKHPYLDTLLCFCLDPGREARALAETLGLSVQQFSEDYFVVLIGEVRIGFHGDPSKKEPEWVPCFAVESLEDCAKSSRAAGFALAKQDHETPRGLIHTAISPGGASVQWMELKK